MMNYGDDMEVIKDKKYMRIQGEELDKKIAKGLDLKLKLSFE